MIFYWVYAMLMTISMVNFALAIIVDAFSGVKSAASESLPVPLELVSLAKYFIAARAEGKGNAFPTEEAAAARVARMMRMTTIMKAPRRAAPTRTGTGLFAVSFQDSSMHGSAQPGAEGGAGATGQTQSPDVGVDGDSLTKSFFDREAPTERRVLVCITSPPQARGAATPLAPPSTCLCALQPLQVLDMNGKEARLREGELAALLLPEIVRSQRRSVESAGRASRLGRLIPARISAMLPSQTSISEVPLAASSVALDPEEAAASLARQLLWCCGESEWVNKNGTVVDKPTLEGAENQRRAELASTLSPAAAGVSTAGIGCGGCASLDPSLPRISPAESPRAPGLAHHAWPLKRPPLPTVSPRARPQLSAAVTRPPLRAPSRRLRCWHSRMFRKRWCAWRHPPASG